ncbi:H-NS family nucleoid-associated regulatory protein [Burkholderia latens]|uniref:H-NS histone family protein n=1 Tax=Burkholderia latens TaxID=488446 RepID=UPI0039A437F5
MSDEELQSLLSLVEAETKKRSERKKRDAQKAIVELATKHGINLSNLESQSVKYRDPENQFNVWSGRGRKPEWVKKALDRGLSLDDLKV